MEQSQPDQPIRRSINQPTSNQTTRKDTPHANSIIVSSLRRLSPAVIMDGKQQDKTLDPGNRSCACLFPTVSRHASAFLKCFDRDDRYTPTH